MKRTAILLLSALLLTGCAKEDGKDMIFENDVNAFCDKLAAIDSSINQIQNISSDEEELSSAKKELLDYLNQLDAVFEDFADMDFPEEHDYLEKMADEASEYMTEAVNTYHRLYDTADGYNVNMEEYAAENYSRAYKRIRVILALFRGETPNVDGLTIQ